MICQAMWLVNFKQYSHLADEITLFVQSRCQRLSVGNGMAAEPLWAALRREWVKIVFENAVPSFSSSVSETTVL